MSSPRLDEAAAWMLLETLRWPSGIPDACPRCATRGRCYFLSPRTGARTTRTGARTARRVWKCGACRQQFSVLTGTALAGTRTPVATWVAKVESHVAGRAEKSAGTAADRTLSAVAELLARSGSPAESD